jgi:hypothetical protein
LLGSAVCRVAGVAFAVVVALGLLGFLGFLGLLAFLIFVVLAFLVLALLLIQMVFLCEEFSVLQIQLTKKVRIVVRGNDSGVVQACQARPLATEDQIGDATHQGKEENDQEPRKAWQASHLVFWAVPAVDECVDCPPYREQ